MPWHLLAASFCLLVTASSAFTPIQWASPRGETLKLTPKSFNGHLPRSYALPQILTIGETSNRMSPQFKANSDNTISVGDWCVEAGGKTAGGAVIVNNCNGGPTQQWNWISEGHGRNMIQLKGTNLCLNVDDKEGSLIGAAVQLQACGSESSTSWLYEAPGSIPSEDASSRSDVRYAAIVFASMTLFGVMGISAWLWRWRAKTLANPSMALPAIQGMSKLLALPTLSYQLSTPPTVRGTASRAAVAMEYKLNNYMLTGPMTPLGNQVLVKTTKTSDITTGGLFMTSSSTEKPTEGVVVLSGPGAVHPDTGTMMPNPVKEGDLVLLNEYSGEKVDYCGEKHTFVSSDEVLGVFEGGVSMVENFQPLEDLVLVKLEEAASETSSGIALATGGSEEQTQGEVLAVGPGRLTSRGEVVPTGISPGDSVIYDLTAATDATIGDTTYKVVAAESCLAKW